MKMEQIEKKISVLDIDSPNAKIYRWFYCLNDSIMPKGLCPYFWKSIFMWLVIIPYFTLVVPVVIGELVDKNYKNGRYPTLIRIFIAILIYIFLFVLFCLLAPILNIFLHFSQMSLMGYLVPEGYVFWCFGIIVGIYILIKYVIDSVKERIRQNKYNKLKRNEFGDPIVKESKPNLLFEFIKAQYEKRCPRIEWKDNRETLNSDNDEE